MRLTQFDSKLLRIPLKRPIPSADDKERHRIDHIHLLVVHLDTDAGHRGCGLAATLHGGGRALKALADDDLGPMLVGEDPLDHERLGLKAARKLLALGRGGLAAQAYSAIDLALWDLKGKAAGLPLYKLLGGVRESAPVFASDTGWLGMSSEEIIDAARPFLDQGMMGIKVQVGGPSPEVDADRVNRIREALGEDMWLAVDADERYDYATALSMGHFFEEEMGIDWFEDPIPHEDIEGHARLVDKLEVPIAVGGVFSELAQFRNCLAVAAVDVLRPGVGALGGLTTWLKVATLADAHHRPIAPALLPEIGVHLACGLPAARAVEYVPWLEPAFVEPPAIVDGHIVPPKLPGLGLEIRLDAIEKYRVNF